MLIQILKLDFLLEVSLAKIRFIDPGIRLSESVANLNYRQRDLWLRLLLTVDDQGRFPGNLKLIKASIWALDSVGLQTLEKDLEVLEDGGFLLLYQESGKRFLQILNWQKYQRSSEWLGESEYPAPKGWVDRFRYHGKENKIIKSENWETCFVGSDLPSNDDDDDLDLNNDGNGNEDPDNDGNGKGKINDGNTGEEIPKPHDKPLNIKGQDAWNFAIGELQKDTSKAQFDTYIANLTLLQTEGSIFTVKAINNPTAELITTRYGATITSLLKGYCGHEVDLQVIVQD